MEFEDLFGHVDSRPKPRVEIDAVIHYACHTCGAPGVFHADPAFAQWYGIVVAAGDPRIGQTVGVLCPHCGKARRDPKSLKLVSSTEQDDGA